MKYRRKPKVLLCSHTVCENCIINSATPEGVHCVICKSKHTLDVTPSKTILINGKYEKLLVTPMEVEIKKKLVQLDSQKWDSELQKKTISMKLIKNFLSELFPTDSDMSFYLN